VHFIQYAAARTAVLNQLALKMSAADADLRVGGCFSGFTADATDQLHVCHMLESQMRTPQQQ
jgi:hypothetical protein